MVVVIVGVGLYSNHISVCISGRIDNKMKVKLHRLSSLLCHCCEVCHLKAMQLFEHLCEAVDEHLLA